MFEIIWRNLILTHRGVPLKTLAKRFFTSVNARRWIFFCKDPKTDLIYTLYQIADTAALMYVLIKGDSHPFDQEQHDYLLKRRIRGAKTNLLLPTPKRIMAWKQKDICPVCEKNLTNSNEALEIHHIKPILQGGNNELSNLILLHKNCHAQITFTKNPKIIATLKAKGLIN